jgi:hypothetical protein
MLYIVWLVRRVCSRVDVVNMVFLCVKVLFI